jgi:hypothetical protein
MRDADRRREATCGIGPPPARSIIPVEAFQQVVPCPGDKQSGGLKLRLCYVLPPRPLPNRIPECAPAAVRGVR